MDNLFDTLMHFMVGAAPAVNPAFHMPPPEVPAPEVKEVKPLPFYPSDAYVKYNRAPETSLTTKDVSAIAAARKKAEETGVLTKDLGEHLLPMAMVEGWGSKMGVVTNGKGFYASRRFVDSLDKMGLEEDKDYMTSYIKGEKHIVPLEGSPAMAAAILGEKSKLKNVGGNIEKTVKAYNGRGKATEDYGAGPVPADVNVYWSKVQAAKRLLEHPLNAAIRGHFQREYRR